MRTSRSRPSRFSRVRRASEPASEGSSRCPPLGRTRAREHDADAPRDLVVPLGASDAAPTVGAIAPPRAPFCAVRIGLGPADGDAKGMPADRSALGRTLWFVGRSGNADLRLTTSVVRSVELPLPSFVPGSLGRRTILHIGRSAGTVLAGVDSNPDHIVEASALVLDRLAALLAAHTE